MYHHTPETGFRSTLVSDYATFLQLGAAGWNEDPYSWGVEVVPLPAELTAAGTVVHHVGIGKDANGNYAYGPAPTVGGISGAQVLRGA
jgi:hypothetical protein